MKMNNTFWLLVLWTTLVGLTTGCTENDEVQTEKGTPVEVVCRLQVAPLDGGQTTRAIGEAEIHDLAVIQFDGTDDEAPAVIARAFDNPASKLTVGLMQPIGDANKLQTLYFIANAGGTFDNFSGTLGELKTKQFSLSETDVQNWKILMTGSSVTKIYTETDVTATLTRRLAKIVFSIDQNGLPSGAALEPLWLQLRSVPSVACPEAPASEISYPEASSELYADWQPFVNDIEGTYTWYIPENRRGKKSGTTVNNPKDKNKNKPDDYCTYLYLEANYYPDAAQRDQGAKRVYYTLYPGANNTDDFTIEGNRSYTVTLKVTGIEGKEDDSRLSATDIPPSLPGANCYMVQPNSFLTFNPHNAPGEAVSNTIDYLKRVGTGVNGDCNIDHVGLVWQTDPGLIRAIYHLKANGEFRIQTADMQGNALIAAYDKDSKILWSWHIWVTDYVLDNVGNDMSGDSLDVPGGHVYKWSDYIWMDRGIGAKRAGLGIGAFGMCYQWGRKDPFLPAIQNTESGDSQDKFEAQATAQTVPMYNSDGERIYVGGQKITTSGNDFGTPMNNPTLFYSNSSQLWYGGSANNSLWQDGVKTCFDPCPAGWRVTPSGVRNNFTTANLKFVYTSTVSDMDICGITCYAIPGLRWPYGGYRDISNGKSKGPGHEGMFWASGSSSGSGYRYGGNENKASTLSRGQSDGQSVRCVKDTTK